MVPFIYRGYMPARGGFWRPGDGPGGCFGGVRAISQKGAKTEVSLAVRDDWAHLRQIGVHVSMKKENDFEFLIDVLILCEHRFGAVPLNACFWE